MYQAITSNFHLLNEDLFDHIITVISSNMDPSNRGQTGPILPNINRFVTRLDPSNLGITLSVEHLPYTYDPANLIINLQYLTVPGPDVDLHIHIFSIYPVNLPTPPIPWQDIADHFLNGRSPVSAASYFYRIYRRHLLHPPIIHSFITNPTPSIHNIFLIVKHMPLSRRPEPFILNYRQFFRPTYNIHIQVLSIYSSYPPIPPIP